MGSKAKKKDRISQITPYLLYRDVAKALVWLERAFGFKEYGERYLNEKGKVNHAAMQHVDGSLLMMGCPGRKYRNPKQLGVVTQMLYVNVDDVDGHYRRAMRAGAKILEEPTDTFYGARRYGAADPEGHQWYFAQELGKK